MTPGFQEQWLAVVLFGASALAIYHGLRIAYRREIANPFLEVRGPKAVLIGLAFLAVGVAGAALAVLGFRVRG